MFAINADTINAGSSERRKKLKIIPLVNRAHAYSFISFIQNSY